MSDFRGCLFSSVKLGNGLYFVHEIWPTISQTAAKPMAIMDWRLSMGMDLFLGVWKRSLRDEFSHIRALSISALA